MGVIDIILILIIAYGMYVGWQRGFIKGVVDFVSLYLASIIASKLSDILFTLGYKAFPFLNFVGKAKGLKSLNIIMWKLILFVLIIALIIFVINRLLMKFGLLDKILDSMVELNLIGKIGGVIAYAFVMAILTFDIILVLMFPGFNINGFTSSNVTKTIANNIPILSMQNKNLYLNEKYALERMSDDDNTASGYKDVNQDIANKMVDSDFVSSKIIDYYEENNMLVGSRTATPKTEKEEKVEEDDDEEEVDESSDDEDEDDADFDEEDEEEEDFDEEDEEEAEEDDADTYCEDFPEDC